MKAKAASAETSEQTSGTMKLTVVISQGEEFLIGRVKEIPAVMTQGETVDEVMENISDALGLFVQDSIENLIEKSSSIDNQLDGEIISTKELEFA